MSEKNNLFLHVCCADCLVRFLVALGYPLPSSATSLIQNYTFLSSSIWTNHKFSQITLFFSNSNIYPSSELNARLIAVKKIATLLNLPLIVENYLPELYFNLPPCQKQLADNLSTSTRCFSCQKLRLKQTYKRFLHENINQNNFTFFSTTMLASSYLEHQQIISLGNDLSPNFLIIHPLNNLKTTGFYKQNYCGCLFSLIEKTKIKFLKN